MGPAERRHCRPANRSFSRPAEPLLLCPLCCRQGERQDEEGMAAFRCSPGTYRASAGAAMPYALMLRAQRFFLLLTAPFNAGHRCSRKSER